MTTPSLDHLTIFDTSPPELVTIAADLRLPLVTPDVASFILHGHSP